MSTPDAVAIARASAEAMWAEDNASRGLGMRLERVGPGAAVLSMEITAAMVNGSAYATAGSSSRWPTARVPSPPTATISA